MRFRLINGELSKSNDIQVMEKLTQRMIAISTIIDLFNESDWQPSEVRMWLQYEKDLALVESKLYTQQQEQQ